MNRLLHTLLCLGPLLSFRTASASLICALFAGAAMGTGSLARGQDEKAARTDAAAQAGRTDWLFFASEGRLGAIRPDGTGEGYPDFGLAAERRWRLGYVSPDGREAELLTPDSGNWWHNDFVGKRFDHARDCR